MSHKCHAQGCEVEVPPRLLMCRHHWYMVPSDLRSRIWETYIPGQEIRKDPSAAYMEAQRAAIRAVAEKEAAQ